MSPGQGDGIEFKRIFKRIAATLAQVSDIPGSQQNFSTQPQSRPQDILTDTTNAEALKL